MTVTQEFRFKIAALCAAGIILATCGGPKKQGGGNPVKPGQGQEVLLNWNQGQGKWMVKLNNGQEQDPATATTLLAEGTGPTMFTVSIAGKKVGFPETGALTVYEKAKTQPPGSNQILGPVLNKKGQLIFYDLNQGDPVKIYYQLNLDNGDSIDPIIDNRGGGMR